LDNKIQIRQDQLSTFQGQHKNYQKVLVELFNFIKENEHQVAQLAPKYITVAEALRRLKNFK